MRINTLDAEAVTAVPAIRDGATFAGACSPWMSLVAQNLPAQRMRPVLAPISALAAPRPDARLAAFRQIPALTEQTAVQAVLLPSAHDTRKPNVYMTRVNAGGDGASGPHPEREPD